LAVQSVDVRGRLNVEADNVQAKLRHASPPIPARVAAGQRGFRLELEQPAYGVACGQAAVLYEDGAVVGAGLITGTSP
jgi:tRNA U34 2-thiouridine synthase MnmA/TrmU